MNIHPIDLNSGRDVNRFIQFPFHLYRNCPQWVPSLIASEKKSLDPRRHPFYEHSEAAFFVAEERGKVCGRIAVMNNRRANKYRGTKDAFFGFFEVVDNCHVAQGLFETTFEWARQRGLKRMLGTRGLIGTDGCGVLVEGFEHRPALNIPYNYAYYGELIEAAGFVKDTDHLSGYLPTNFDYPQRLIDIAEKVKKRSGFWIKSFETKDEMRQWIPNVKAVHTQAFQHNHTFYPHTEAEFEAAAHTLISIADPELIKLVMKGDEVIGFIFSYKDISEGLQKARGRLWPLGWFHLMRAQKTTEWANVNGVGLLPQYQGLGANAVLYTELARTIFEQKFAHVDIVLVDEHNFKSKSDMESIGVRWYKRHRSYQRDL